MKRAVMWQSFLYHRKEHVRLTYKFQREHDKSHITFHSFFHYYVKEKPDMINAERDNRKNADIKTNQKAAAQGKGKKVERT